MFIHYIGIQYIIYTYSILFIKLVKHISHDDLNTIIWITNLLTSCSKCMYANES